MHFRVRRYVNRTSIILLVSMAGVIAVGCNSINPFSSALFNFNLTGTVADGGVGGGGGNTLPPGGSSGNSGSDIIDSLDQLPLAERTIQMNIQNASQQFVKFAITFAVSAGPGGFVPDNMIQDYLDAGYVDSIPPDSGDNLVVGCDTLSLLRGTRLLTIQFGTVLGQIIKVPPNPDTTNTDPNANLPSTPLQTRDGNAFIPVPEVIVLGNEDPDFVCAGGSAVGDLCSQRGFVYINTFDVPVGKAPESSRIQGTICETGFGTAPEWRLDETRDSQHQPFQFVAGGSVTITILDRALDGLANTRNQAVWLVTDANDATIHFPDQ